MFYVSILTQRVVALRAAPLNTFTVMIFISLDVAHWRSCVAVLSIRKALFASVTRIWPVFPFLFWNKSWMTSSVEVRPLSLGPVWPFGPSKAAPFSGITSSEAANRIPWLCTVLVPSFWAINGVFHPEFGLLLFSSTKLFLCLLLVSNKWIRETAQAFNRRCTLDANEWSDASLDLRFPHTQLDLAMCGVSLIVLFYRTLVNDLLGLFWFIALPVYCNGDWWCWWCLFVMILHSWQWGSCNTPLTSVLRIIVWVNDNLSDVITDQ